MRGCLELERALRPLVDPGGPFWGLVAQGFCRRPEMAGALAAPDKGEKLSRGSALGSRGDAGLDWRKMTDVHYWLSRVEQLRFRWLDLCVSGSSSCLGTTPHHPPPKGPSDVNSLQIKFVACRDYANGDSKSATIALPSLGRWPRFRFGSPKP